MGVIFRGEVEEEGEEGVSVGGDVGLEAGAVSYVWFLG